VFSRAHVCTGNLVRSLTGAELLCVISDALLRFRASGLVIR
jgi:hypothetical protein